MGAVNCIIASIVELKYEGVLGWGHINWKYNCIYSRIEIYAQNTHKKHISLASIIASIVELKYIELKKCQTGSGVVYNCIYSRIEIY